MAKRLKESKLTNKKIIQILQKDGSIEFYPICINCSHEVIDLVMHEFDACEIHIQKLGREQDTMYYLGITAGYDDETQE